MESHDIIKNPVSTEKAIRLMEAENKLLFDVDIKATKTEVKKAVEEMFKVKVRKVNTYISRKGKKRAYVKLADENPAMDIATELGMI
ncbi:50S ribosomal protein L23 [Candidatus Woesearchaeota archaeon]|jgi:large subunit ribosomal protein L23|nr:50S ribosomal protein L23 [Candidatus Woesearchaeota archaeon]MBT4368719.1 50S ribosomal protein L23 [Candidatus Woesearchaeota archaeon]MBT4712008.1 50S ribosomal protein L23 [Candidatus Woesearchaeota archaeon]MBT6638903.1 50S ribosomal protein L23 [Candidatus Woesearchaeota archaeon]MBT7134547.1 50S ribosomal protein L23 [Candidatus Woesearchaeota archaeon]